MYAHKRFICPFLLLFLWLIIPQIPLFAATLHVPSEFPTIKSAISASSNRDTILVSPGRYVENLAFYGKNVVLGSLYMTTGEAIYTSITIIDGGYANSVIRYEGVDSTARLCGFTIQNGQFGAGAGILCINSNPILENLIITNNDAFSGSPPWAASGTGGGIEFADSSSVVIRNCTIFGNKSDWAGGGIFLSDGSNATIENCHIFDNSAPSGGGISISGSSPIIINCVIRDNTADRIGGGIGIGSYANPKIINCLIAGNSAATGGGMCSNWEGYPELINVSITGNKAAEYGGGILAVGRTVVSNQNSIFWNNSPDEIHHASSGIMGIQYSDVHNGQNGVGGSGEVQWSDTNIDLDPGFNVANGMAYIRDASSPVIDAGNPDTTGLGLPPLDLAGNPRIIGGRIDMGAFEYSGGPHAMLPPQPRFVQYPPAGTTATTFIFDAYPTTDNVDSLWGLQFRWDWEGDGAWDTPFSYNYVGEHAFGHAGTYAVTLEVKDSDGLTSTARENLTMGATVTHNFNEEISFTIPGEQSLISVPFPDAVISIRFLFGDVMGKTMRITAFGGDPPQNVHNGPRFAKVIGYYSIYSTSISSFTGTLAVAYTDTALKESGIREGDLELAYWNDKTRKWNALITTIDSAANKASTTIDHFSLWALADRTDDLITGVHDDEAEPGTVTSYQLYQNYPNPFNPITAIRFDLPKAERVRIAIYNILGQSVRLLADEAFPAGSHNVSWDGRDDGGRLLSSGIYIYEIRAGEYIGRKKMTMLR